MNLELLREVLGWCVLINYGVLLWWFAFFTLARDRAYRIHTRWFNITPDRFDAIHYQAMTYFKLAVFIFNLVPWLALHIVS